MDDHVVHARLAVADVVFESAGQLVGVWQRHVGRHRDGDEHDEAAGSLQQAQFSWWVARQVEHDLVDALALGLVGSGGVLVGVRGDRLLERFQVRMYVLDTGLVAQRRLNALRDVVRIADGNIRGQLQVQGEADMAIVLEGNSTSAMRRAWREGPTEIERLPGRGHGCPWAIDAVFVDEDHGLDPVA
jgi:hypothetical protein